ncbi:MAG: hypothetical protein WCX82_02885 [archaeon]|jgi:hypothetical protein
MIPLHKEFPNLRYQKITWENIDDLTPELIKRLRKIGSFGYDKDFWKNRTVTNNNKIIIYLIKDGSSVLGFITGELYSLSDHYIDLKFERFVNKELNGKDLTTQEIENFYNKNRVKTKSNIFQINEFAIDENHQKKDLGTILMARVVADQRAKYKSKFVIMYPLENTKKVNKRVVGNSPILVKIFKTNKENLSEIKQVFRNFNKSHFRYILKRQDTNEMIVITKNPNYKKREIRSKVK